jgi:DeoR family glycerol-3-phosphate regulon repressor
MLISRQNTILEIARQSGRVMVDELAQRFEVTPQTIRKDLNELCDKRMLTRIHGGAILSSGVENVGYDARRMIASEEKEAIGRAAAARIPEQASLFINIGTTTEAVARALLQHNGLMVITNNLNVASLMRGYPQIEVVIAGGVVRHSDGGVVGEAAVDFIRQFKVDIAVIGASAIDQDGALLDYDYREVRVAQAILSNTRHVMLVCDSSKFERSAPVRIGHLSQVTTFVTDHCASDGIRRICMESGVELVEALGSEVSADITPIFA